jgi:hypothetical protein
MSSAEKKPEQQQELEFTPGIIPIRMFSKSGNSGPSWWEERGGYIYGDTTLGYYRDAAPEEHYIPTHLSTGYRLGSGSLSIEACEAFIRKAAELIDWRAIDENGPPVELVPTLNQLKAEFAALFSKEKEKEKEKEQQQQQPKEVETVS